MKHPHKELIEAWLNDMSIKFEKNCSSNMLEDEWFGVTVQNLIKDVSGVGTFRIKPREFKEGEWYPCIDYDNELCICCYKNNEFYLSSDDLCGETADEMIWIGESLGKIKFGE